MKFYLITLVLEFILIMSGFSQKASPQLKQYYDWAKKSEEKEDYQRALIQIDSAIILDSSILRNYSLKGELLFLSHQYIEGINEFDYVLKKDTLNFEARDSRANAEMNLKQYNASINDYKFLIAHYPDSAQSYIGIGTNYMKLQFWDSAIYFLSEAIKIDPYRDWSYVELSDIYIILKNLNKSIDIINGAESKFKISAEMHNNRGYSYLLLKNYEHATRDFQAVLDSKDENHFSYIPKALAMNNLGYIQCMNQKYDSALYLINASIEKLPKNAYAYRNKALVYIGLKDYKTACENLFIAKNLQIRGFEVDDLENLIDNYCK